MELFLFIPCSGRGRLRDGSSSMIVHRRQRIVYVELLPVPENDPEASFLLQVPLAVRLLPDTATMADQNEPSVVVPAEVRPMATMFPTCST
jgi:hypothetical protein